MKTNRKIVTEEEEGLVTKYFVLNACKSIQVKFIVYIHLAFVRAISPASLQV